MLTLLFDALLLEILGEFGRRLEGVVRLHAAAAVHLAHAQLAVGHAAAVAHAVGGARARVAQDAHRKRMDLFDAPGALLLVHEPCGLLGRHGLAVSLELACVVEGVIVAALVRVNEHVEGGLDAQEFVGLHAAVAIGVVDQRLLLVCLPHVLLSARRVEAELLVERSQDGQEVDEDEEEVKVIDEGAIG